MFGLSKRRAVYTHARVYKYLLRVGVYCYIMIYDRRMKIAPPLKRQKRKQNLSSLGDCVSKAILYNIRYITRIPSHDDSPPQ